MAPETFVDTSGFYALLVTSFTDCVSFLVMRAERVNVALTKDAHFRTAGFEALL